MSNQENKSLEMSELPQKSTLPAKDYFDASFKNLGLFTLVIETVVSGDFVAYIARETLDGRELEKELSPSILVEKKPGPRTLQLRKFKQELLQSFFVRSVDNFQIYLVDILREVLRQKPEILRSRQQTITLDYALQFPTIDELIMDIIESKVNTLSNKGFSELEHWYDEKGIPLVVEKEQHQFVVELIATRNIIVHNRGRIDEKYLRTIPTSTNKIGELRELETKDLFTAISILNSIVSSTDIKVAQKFNLKTYKLNDKKLRIRSTTSS